MREGAAVRERDELCEGVRALGAAEESCVSALGADEGCAACLRGESCREDGGC